VVDAITIVLLRLTVIGKWAYAFGSNPRASELSGADRLTTNLVLYGTSGLTAGLTGTLLSGVTRQGYIGIGDPYLLMSIAAVVIGGASILGGRGSYVGTIAGAILLITVTSLITVINASAGLRNIFLGLLVLGLLVLYAREGRR
jgi:ribose transport system permease protein